MSSTLSTRSLTVALLPALSDGGATATSRITGSLTVALRPLARISSTRSLTVALRPWQSPIEVLTHHTKWVCTHHPIGC